jgi:hypothetical protein
MNEGSGRMAVKKKNYRRLRNELKRATHKARKEYQEGISENWTLCDLLYM